MKAHIWSMFNGLKSFITSGLPAQLRAIEAEIGDGIVLPDPAKHVLGYADLFNSDRYPLVCYIWGNTPVEGQTTKSDELSPLALILVSFRHSNPDTLESILLRYPSAFLNLCGADPGLGGTCETSQIEMIDPGHPGGETKEHGVIAISLRMFYEALY